MILYGPYSYLHDRDCRVVFYVATVRAIFVLYIHEMFWKQVNVMVVMVCNNWKHHCNGKCFLQNHLAWLKFFFTRIKNIRGVP